MPDSMLGAVFGQDLGVEADPVALDPRQRCHRRAAIAAEAFKQTAFGRDTEMGRPMVNRREQAQRCVVIGKRLDADRTLSRRRQQRFERHADFGPAEAIETGGGEQGRIDLAFLQLGEPGRDIAAERLDDEIGPRTPELRRAPWR